ncbi:protein of unknown function [Pararobbsia alpina]
MRALKFGSLFSFDSLALVEKREPAPLPDSARPIAQRFVRVARCSPLYPSSWRILRQINDTNQRIFISSP